MTSVRDSISHLRQFPRDVTVDVSEVARFLGMSRPLSVRGLCNRASAVSPSVAFVQPVVTGAALGGEARLVVNSDGSYAFSGFMRATGLPSFKYNVAMLVRAGSGTVALAVRHSGSVFGTDTPGDRQDNWDEKGGPRDTALAIQRNWPDIAAGTAQVSHSEDVSGVLGVAGDIIKVVGEFFVLGQALGTQAAGCLMIGGELHDAGLALPGLGGVLGLTIVGGTVFIFGPGVLMPAVVLGVAAGAVIDSMVQLRPMDYREKYFAQQVFADSVDYERIRLTNLSGVAGKAFTMPAMDGTILLNIGNAMESPMNAVYPKHYPVPGQILIHELTHAWQIQHSTYTAGWLCDGVLTQTVGPAHPYDHGAAGPPWGTGFGLESQAAIVDQWFAGLDTPSGTPMSKDSPFFGYILNDVRAGQN